MNQKHVTVNTAHWTGRLAHTWNYIGYDECNYTHTPGGMALLEKFGRLERPYYVRCHHMLCTGILHPFYKWGSTNAYLEDAEGNPIHNFDVIDKMMDTLLARNCKPFFEIGFMPRDLADPRAAENGKSYFIAAGNSEYQRVGWAMPPKDYGKWYDLIRHLVAHCVERYGAREVESWYWEMWNEPDISYWRGTPEEFHKLYDYTEAAVHAALPTARFGGPATCGDRNPQGRATRFLDAFLAHVTGGVNYVTGAKGTRIDYITFHTKGGGYNFDTLHKKQTPSVETLVENVRTQSMVIRKYGLDHLEVVLSEADPDGWAAGGRFDNFNLNFRNTEYYASYVAAGYKGIYDLAEELGMDIRPLAWAFMFEGERCFEGTRTFSTQGIDKAVFNLFKLYAKLGEQRVELQGDVDGWATVTGEKEAAILLYRHDDDWDAQDDAEVTLTVEGLPFSGNVRVTHYRIDGQHSNAYAAWVAQGMPDWPQDGQYDAIKARDGLEYLEPPHTAVLEDGRLNQCFSMPAHAVSLLLLRQG